MSDKLITSPVGAHRLVTDYRTGKDADGELIAYDQEVFEYRANAAIAQGDLCYFVVPTATVPLSVKAKAASPESIVLWAGVALAAAAAGGVVQVVRSGACEVNVGANTPAAGNAVIPDAATAAIAAASAAAIDATT